MFRLYSYTKGVTKYCAMGIAPPTVMFELVPFAKLTQRGRASQEDWRIRIGQAGTSACRRRTCEGTQYGRAIAQT